MIHGISEHSERHHHTRNFLLEQGWEVVRFDLRGMGKSGGRRQYIERFDQYVADTSTVYHWAIKPNDKLPIYCLGHSLGGAIALHFASIYHRELAGLMLSAPAHILGDGISPLKIAIGRAISPVLPWLRIPGSTKSWISRDPDEVKAYQTDPLACHFNTVRQGDEILRALIEIPSLSKNIHCPTLICHGTGDRIIRLEGSFEILRAIGAKDKTFHVLPSAYHELHNDYGKEDYFQLIHTWLSKEHYR